MLIYQGKNLMLIYTFPEKFTKNETNRLRLLFFTNFFRFYGYRGNDRGNHLWQRIAGQTFLIIPGQP